MEKRCKVKRALLVLFKLLVLQFTCTQGNYYFTSHPSYSSSTLDISASSSCTFSGSMTSAQQQCRRKCALQADCAAFNIKLLKGDQNLGTFQCLSFDKNACQWNVTGFQTINGTKTVSMLWEKLDDTKYRAKPCIEHCKVKHRGDCFACRGYAELKGFDCDIAPRTCADYPPSAHTEWSSANIWPRGFYGKRIQARCYKQYTSFITYYGNPQDSQCSVATLGWDGSRSASNSSTLNSFTRQIDWELISMLVSVSRQKVLALFLVIGLGGEDHTFSGFSLTPYGELSLGSALNSTRPTMFPLPILKIPFVRGDNNCGPFWQFQANVSVCQQRTHLLLNAKQYTWDNLLSYAYNYPSATMAFI